MSLDAPQECSPKTNVYQWKSDSTLADLDALTAGAGATGYYSIDAGNNDLLVWNWNNTVQSVAVSVDDYFILSQAKPSYVGAASDAACLYSVITKVL